MLYHDPPQRVVHAGVWWFLIARVVIVVEVGMCTVAFGGLLLLLL